MTERDSLVARLKEAAGYESVINRERSAQLLLEAAASLSRPEQAVTALEPETAKARAAAVICEVGALCGWPGPDCKSREAAEALFDAGLLSCLTTAAPLQADASAPASQAIGAREAFKAGWWTNAAYDHPAEYLSGCEEADWSEYQKKGLDTYVTDLLSAAREEADTALHPAPEAASASILAGGVREALEDVCRCKNTITAGPCIVCGRPKLVTKEWFERKAALENDHEIGAGSMEDRLVIVPRKPRAVQLEQAASNLADEFGADFVLENKRFALAVYDEMLSAGAVKSLSEEMRDRAFEAASAAVPASVDIGRGELDRIVNAALATLSLPDVGATDTAPSPKGVSDGVRATVKKVRDDYAEQSKFADIEAIGYFREFIRRIDAALFQEPVPATAEERAASKEGA